MTRTTNKKQFTGETIVGHRHPGCRHNPVHGSLPADILENMAQPEDPDVRRVAIEVIGQSEALRATRATLATMAMMAVPPSPAGIKNGFRFPGDLVRKEGEGPTGDDAVNEAHEITIQSSGADKHFSCGDMSVPKDAYPLLEFLQKTCE